MKYLQPVVGAANAFWVGLFFLFGCNPTYAPPARMGHYGAPGHHQKKSVGVGGTWVQADGHGGAGQLVLAPWSRTQLEIGVGGQPDRFTMGFVGWRTAPIDVRDSHFVVKPTLDMEGGLGAGVGGNRCYPKKDICSDTPFNHRFAYGGYVGVGVGLNIRWFDLFSRLRAQLTVATQVPKTLWLTAVSGMEINIGNTAFYFNGGGGRYQNPADEEVGLIAEAGVRIRFSVR